MVKNDSEWLTCIADSMAALLSTCVEKDAVMIGQSSKAGYIRESPELSCPSSGPSDSGLQNPFHSSRSASSYLARPERLPRPQYAART